VVSDQVGLLGLFQHIEVAVVSAFDTGVLAHHLDALIDAVTSAVHSHSLSGITDPEVLLVLAAVELHK